MDCKGNHDLFEVKRLTNHVERSDTGGRVLADASTIVVCAYCGHTRQIFETGRVLIVREVGEVMRTQSNVVNG